MNTLDRELSSLFPVSPGPAPVTPQVQEQVEVLQQVVATPVTYAVAIGPCTDARVFQFRNLRRKDSDILIQRPQDDAWGVLLRRPDGHWTVAAFMWDNAKGFHFYAFGTRWDAQAMAGQLMRLQGVPA